jgi:hypothetical protein
VQFGAAACFVAQHQQLALDGKRRIGAQVGLTASDDPERADRGRCVCRGSPTAELEHGTEIDDKDDLARLRAGRQSGVPSVCLFRIGMSATVSAGWCDGRPESK